MTADDVYAQAARPRDELLAELAAADASRPWVVVLQGSDGAEHRVSTHWWEWLAYWRASQHTARAAELGARYTVRRAES